MRVSIILADFAESDQQAGKVHLLGGGWSVTAGPAPMSVVVFVECPWDQTNKQRHFELVMLDADGNNVMLPGPAGMQPVKIDGELEVGRPPGLPEGTPVSLPPLAVNFGPLPLAPGRYEFQFSIDGECQEEWRRAFTRIA